MNGDDAILDLRRTYERDSLEETRASTDPFVQFRTWIEDALAGNLVEPNAMTLATVDAAGQPSARIVLLRAWDERGFVFYTNFASRKGDDLAGNARAALLFYWDKLERQVRVEGLAARLASADSDAYFARRPRGHQLSAWASAQSRTIADRGSLEAAMAAADRRYPDAVPRPDYWGGYRVAPQRFEFWQGRPDRVHDRLVYERDAGGWQRRRLAP